MKYKAVLFDLDGTLCDTTEGVYAAVQYSLEKTGHSPADDALLKAFVGPPLTYTYTKLCGMTEEETERAIIAFREFYADKGLYMSKPYEGMAELIMLLKKKGVRVGTATYKREDFAKSLLGSKFPEGCFDVIKGSDSACSITKAQIVEAAISELGADKSETVLIGDTHFDAEGAAAAGVGFIAVTYGCGFENEHDAEGYPHVGVCGNTREIGALLDIL